MPINLKGSISTPESKAETGTSSSQLGVGVIVLYEHDAQPLLGIITSFEKLRYSVTNMRGRVVKLAPNRLCPLSSAGQSLVSTGDSDEQKGKQLLQIFDEGQEAASDVDLAAAWELVALEPRDYTSHEVAGLLFSETNLKTQLSVLLALISDRIYFKRRKYLFQHRPPEVIEELKRAEELRKQRQAIYAELLEFFRAKDREKSDLSEQAEQMLDELKAFASESSDAPQNPSKELKRFVDSAREELSVTRGRGPNERAYYLLRHIGIFDEFTNLALSRYAVESPFATAALEEADAIADAIKQSPPSADSHESRWIITIDDSTTLDRDDALSIRQIDGGYEFGIHITDIASQIDHESALGVNIGHRGTSVYLPEGVFPMLPHSLSEDAMSLTAGEPRRCVSLYIQTDSSFSILSHHFASEVVTVDENLDYDQVDEMREREEIKTLLDFSAACEATRKERGALRMPKRDLILATNPSSESDRGTVQLRIFNEAAPSRSMVGEMMVLFNHLSAEAIARAQLPAIFRTQEKSNVSESDRRRIEAIPEGPARDYAWRGTLNRSQQQLTPGPHATLGLNAYCQASSPIRRAIDYLNQQQLRVATGLSKEVFDEAFIREYLQHLEPSLMRAAQASRESRRFWLLHYLRQSHRDDHFEATVVRNDGKFPLVELKEVPFFNMLDSRDQLRLGTKLKVKFGAIIPEENVLKLKLA